VKHAIDLVVTNAAGDASTGVKGKISEKGIKMRSLIRKFALGTGSVLALVIGAAALNSALDSGADAGNTISVGAKPAAIRISDILGTSDSLRKDDIRWAQVGLRFRGLYKGSLDGVLGPETKRALTQFQQNNGLARTASVDAQTWDALTSSSGIAEGSSSMPSDTNRPGSMTNSSPASDLGR
jgi:peptidoglycan hydrolase-like protein with peptidoglycan-binding domain